MGSFLNVVLDVFRWEGSPEDQHNALIWRDLWGTSWHCPWHPIVLYLYVAGTIAGCRESEYIGDTWIVLSLWRQLGTPMVVGPRCGDQGRGTDSRARFRLVYDFGLSAKFLGQTWWAQLPILAPDVAICTRFATLAREFAFWPQGHHFFQSILPRCHFQDPAARDPPTHPNDGFVNPGGIKMQILAGGV